MLETLAHLFTPQQSNNHRPRILHPEGFVILTAIALIFHVLIKTMPSLATNGSVLGFSSSITTTQVLNDINAQREKAGIPDLVQNDKLTQAASAKATNMFSEQYWAHVSPSGITPWVFFKNAGYNYSIAGENLARDFGDTDTMVAAWMASPSHKENILNTHYVDTGIAVMNGQLLGTQTTLVVQLFGAPQVAQPTVQANGNQANFIVTQVQAESQQAGTLNKALPQPTPATLQQTTPSTVPIYTPLQVSKSVALGMVILLVAALIYDLFVEYRHKTVRITGKNLAHVALFIAIAVTVIFFKGGLLL